MSDEEAGQCDPQQLVLLSPPAARDAQSLAEVVDGIEVRHRTNQGIPLSGTSDSMPIAFFRIS